MSDLRARGNLQEINSLLRPTAYPALAYRKKKKKRKPKAPPGPMQGDLHWKGQPAGRAPAVAGRQQHPGGLEALGGARWVTAAGREPGQRGAGRERAGGRGRAPGAGRLARWEPVCLAGPPHLGSICVSLEPDRRLQAVRKRRCEGPDTCPANERRRKAGLSLRSRIKSGGGRKSPFYLYCEETRCVHQQLDRANLAA